jgi:hypothetical protein
LNYFKIRFQLVLLKSELCDYANISDSHQRKEFCLWPFEGVSQGNDFANSIHLHSFQRLSETRSYHYYRLSEIL